MSEETVTWNLRVETSEAVTNIAELNRGLTTYLALAHRMGLPENIMDALTLLQQIRVAAQTAYRSIMMLYTSTGPIGWAIGLGGLALSGFMAADMATRRPRP
jgi:hypothetical protein